MKKRFIFLIMILAGLFLAENSYAKFNFGIKIGYNASKLSSSLDSIKASFGSGFHVGAFFRIGNRVHLQPEIYYSYSGSTVSNSDPSNDWKQKIITGSIDIPVLLGINIIQSKLIKWRIDAGPVASFMVNSKVKDLTLTGPVQTSNLNTTNWYIQAGTGIDMWFLTLDLRYQAGLNNILTDVTGNNGQIYSVDSKNNLIQVSLGFKF
jgi:hypothetical protein